MLPGQHPDRLKANQITAFETGSVKYDRIQWYVLSLLTQE